MLCTCIYYHFLLSSVHNHRQGDEEHEPRTVCFRRLQYGRISRFPTARQRFIVQRERHESVEYFCDSFIGIGLEVNATGITRHDHRVFEYAYRCEQVLLLQVQVADVLVARQDALAVRLHSTVKSSMWLLVDLWPYMQVW